MFNLTVKDVLSIVVSISFIIYFINELEANKENLEKLQKLVVMQADTVSNHNKLIESLFENGGK